MKPENPIFRKVRPLHLGQNRESVEIDAPVADSLYLPSDKISGFIESLELLVSNEKASDQLVIISVDGPRADDLNDFIGFNPTIYRVMVTEHLLRVRHLLRQIFDQRSRFVLVTNGDLLGSWFELGLVCGKVIVLDHLARIGFSQLAYGFLPALGSFEIFDKLTDIGGKSFWEKGFLWNALDVPKSLNIIVIPVGSSRVDLLNIVGVDTSKYRLTKSLKSSRNLPYPGTWSGTKTMRKKLAGIIWDEFWNHLSRLERFDFCPLDLIFRSWFETSEHSVLTHSAASLYGPSAFEKLKVEHIDRVWVDLDSYLPPAKVMIQWVNVEVGVVFHSESREKLITSLRRIHEKLSDGLNKSDFISFWMDKVSWFVGGSSPQVDDLRQMKFFPDGTLVLHWIGSEMKLVRLAGNNIHAKVGTAELAHKGPNIKGPAKGLEGSLNWALGLAYKNCIPTYQVDDLGMPVSHLLRGCFLEVLVAEASRRKSGIKELFKWLEGDGWGNVADEAWWSTHVGHRYHQWKPGPGIAKLSPSGLSTELRDIASWNQVLRLIKTREFELGGSTRSPQRSVGSLFSEHMLIFATLVGLKLYGMGCFENLVAVDLMVRYSLEVPDRFGSPLGYLNRLGYEMLFEICQLYHKGWEFEDYLGALNQ